MKNSYYSMIALFLIGTKAYAQNKDASKFKITKLKKIVLSLFFVLFFSTITFAQWSKVPVEAPGAYTLAVTANGNLIGLDYSKRYNGTTYGIYLSEDDGAKWEKATTPANNYTSYLNYNGYVFIGGDKGVVLRSADNGKTWSTFSYAGAFSKEADNLSDVYSMIAYNDKIYLACFEAGICYSEDNGETWIPTENESLDPLENPSGLPVYVMYILEGKLYASGVTTYVLNEANKTWTFIEEVPYASAVTELKGFTYVAYTAQGGPYGIRKTKDGINWTEISLPSTFWDNMVKSIHSDGEYLYMSGSSSGVLYSNNDGKTWDSYNNENYPEVLLGSGLYITATSLNSHKGKLYASLFSTFGSPPAGGFYTAPLMNTTISIQSEEKQDLIRIYPNPMRDVMYIDGDYHSLEIYNTAGKIVMKSSGAKQINVANLLPGVYIVKVFNNGKIETYKIVK